MSDWFTRKGGRRMGRIPYWTEERDRQLTQLFYEKKPDQEIAETMGRRVTTIINRRQILNLLRINGTTRVKEAGLISTIVFPKFENITRAEARKIYITAPPCGKISRQYGRSLTGNSSALCADKGNISG